MPKDMIGHNYLGPDSNHVIVAEARPLIDCLKEITGKHLYDQQTQPILECCRDVNNLSLEIRKSNEDLKKPDIYILECECGNKHTRVMLDTAKIGMFMAKGEDDE